MMKTTKFKMSFFYIFFLSFIPLVVLSCKSEQEKKIETVLGLAGDNRGELEAVLEYYKTIKPDEEKLDAAKFLIENMRFQKSLIPEIELKFPFIDAYIEKADSLLFAHVSNTHPDSLYTTTTKSKFKTVKQEFKASNPLPIVDSVGDYKMIDVYDCQVLKSEFLIDHIDLMFKVRADNPKALQDKLVFYECVLPYKTIPFYAMINSSTDYYKLFNKYFTDIPIDSIESTVKRYNFVINEFKYMLMKNPYGKFFGIQELFFFGFMDCVRIADFGAHILRARGIPVVVEQLSAFRHFTDSHFICSTPESQDRWLTFTPEANLPKYMDKELYNAMNLYRIMYSEQPNSPFFLRGKNEYIPGNLASPFIMDATKYDMAVTSIDIPFDKKTKNKLAYLAVFNRGVYNAIQPVTWGKIDGDVVRFENVVPDRFYFPIYFDSNGGIIPFNNPFYLGEDGQITYPDETKIENIEKEFVDIVITAKYPRRLKEVNSTEGLIGSVILGANNSLFEKADTLATVQSLLNPSFQDLKLELSKGPYKYYKFSTTASHPTAYIGEIEFLTSQDYKYNNIVKPSPLPILKPEDVFAEDDNYVKVLGAPSEDGKKRPESDGNPQTGPRGSAYILFPLEKPMYITTVRLMPINGDNGVNIGDTYQIFYLEQGKWILHETVEAKYNHIKTRIPKGRLYWLRNITKGKEELPFFTDENGEQKFIYTMF